MNGRYWIIDEINFNVLGTFDSRGDAVDYVAALLTVNDDEYLDELTVTSDQGAPLTGDVLRAALRNRAMARERVESAGGGNAGHGGYTSPAEAMAAKDCK